MNKFLTGPSSKIDWLLMHDSSGAKLSCSTDDQSCISLPNDADEMISEQICERSNEVEVGLCDNRECVTQEASDMLNNFVVHSNDTGSPPTTSPHNSVSGGNLQYPSTNEDASTRATLENIHPSTSSLDCKTDLANLNDWLFEGTQHPPLANVIPDPQYGFQKNSSGSIVSHIHDGADRSHDPWSPAAQTGSSGLVAESHDLVDNVDGCMAKRCKLVVPTRLENTSLFTSPPVMTDTDDHKDLSTGVCVPASTRTTMDISNSAKNSPDSLPPKPSSCKNAVSASSTQVHYCNLCGKQYRHAASLRNHMRKHEIGALTSKRYRCPYCLYSSQYNRNVTKHIETTHCNLETFLPVRANLPTSQCHIKFNPQSRDCVSHKLNSPNWKYPNADQTFYSTLPISHPKTDHCAFPNSRRSTTYYRNTVHTASYKPAMSASEASYSGRSSQRSDASAFPDLFHDHTDKPPNDTVGSPGMSLTHGVYHCDAPGCSRTFKTSKYLANHFSDCHESKSKCSFDACHSETQRFPDVTCDVYNERKNSLQELLGPDRNDTVLHGSTSMVCNKQPADGGFAEIQRFPDVYKPRVVKRQYGECNLGDTFGLTATAYSKNACYPHPAFTDTAKPNLSDIYSFPGSNFNISLSNGLNDHPGIHRPTETPLPESPNLVAATLHPSERSVVSLPNGLVDNSVGIEFDLSPSTEQHIHYYDSLHRNVVVPEQCQPHESLRASTIFTSDTRVSQMDAVNQQSNLINETPLTSTRCVQASSSTVEQLLCAPDPPTDDIHRTTNPRLQEVWVNDENKCIGNASRTLQVTHKSSIYHTSEDNDFVNSQCESLDKPHYFTGVSGASSDSFTFRELSNETDAFFSDLEEILAREVPLFDRSTPQQANNTMVAGDINLKPDSAIAKSPSVCAGIKLLNAASLASGDSGLESWSSSSSCSAGPNSSVWGTHETHTQLKSSPLSTTPQPTTYPATVSALEHPTIPTFGRSSILGDQLTDEQLMGLQTTDEKEVTLTSSGHLDANLEDPSGPSLWNPVSSSSFGYDQHLFLPTRLPTTLDRELNYRSSVGTVPHAQAEYTAHPMVQPSSRVLRTGEYGGRTTAMAYCTYDASEGTAAFGSLNRMERYEYDSSLARHENPGFPTRAPFQDSFATRFNNPVQMAVSAVTHSMRSTERIDTVRPGFISASDSYGLPVHHPYYGSSSHGKHVHENNCIVMCSESTRQAIPSYPMSANHSYSIHDPSLSDSIVPTYAPPLDFGSVLVGAESKRDFSTNSQTQLPHQSGGYGCFPNRNSGASHPSDVSISERTYIPSSFSTARSAWGFGQHHPFTGCHPLYQQQQQQNYRTYCQQSYEVAAYAEQQNYPTDPGSHHQPQRGNRHVTPLGPSQRTIPHSALVPMQPPLQQQCSSTLNYYKRAASTNFPCMRPLQAPATPHNQTIGIPAHVSHVQQATSSSRLHDSNTTSHDMYSVPVWPVADHSVAVTTHLRLTTCASDGICMHGMDPVPNRHVDPNTLASASRSDFPYNSTTKLSDPSIDFSKTQEIASVVDETGVTVCAHHSVTTVQSPPISGVQQVEWPPSQSIESTGTVNPNYHLANTLC